MNPDFTQPMSPNTLRFLQAVGGLQTPDGKPIPKEALLPREQQPASFECFEDGTRVIKPDPLKFLEVQPQAETQPNTDAPVYAKPSHLITFAEQVGGAVSQSLGRSKMYENKPEFTECFQTMMATLIGGMGITMAAFIMKNEGELYESVAEIVKQNIIEAAKRSAR